MNNPEEQPIRLSIYEYDSLLRSDEEIIDYAINSCGIDLATCIEDLSEEASKCYLRYMAKDGYCPSLKDVVRGYMINHVKTNYPEHIFNQDCKYETY